MKQVVGIDLGTTNSALTYWREGDAQLSVLDVAQLAAPGRLVRQHLLPSFLYIPLEGELTAADTRLPWQSKSIAAGASLLGDGQADSASMQAVVAGLWARERGSLLPERLISSAKSWLGNRFVDRHGAILPWRSEIAQGKRSPVEASSEYLRHLVAAFAYDHASGQAEDRTTQEQNTHYVLTVPASFDEVARNLTYEAAQRAGLTELTLLEEPLAAFYAWIAACGDGWRQQVKPGDVVLVCDVGGGTTDFSLIAVSETNGQLALERISVGDHLLLGGDNMDLALAYSVRRDLEAQGHKLDHWQFLSLVGEARRAKEQLLSDPNLAELPIAVASRGASLFASTLSTTIARTKVEEILLDGFLPLTASHEVPAPRRSIGIQEFGLSYETDAAISRHMARFLQRSRQNVESNPALAKQVAERLSADNKLLLPTAVLFNGGVFHANVLRERVLKLLQQWHGGQAIKELVGADLDLAVAMGASYYGRMRVTGRGIRVRSGTARSYYIGVESSMPAVPGVTPPVNGLCLVPQGTDEGSEIELTQQQFGLVVGEPVEFRFFSSTVRAGDTAGDVIEDAARELEETARLGLTLASEGHQDGEVIPVRLDAVVTPVGTLQLAMKEGMKQGKAGKKWQLEFDVRAHEQI